MYNSKEQYNIGWYDYGARYYDPSIARWSTVDPLAELDQSGTAYNYVFNSPINYVDPFGLTLEKTGADGLNNSQWMKATNPANFESLSRNNRTLSKYYQSANRADYVQSLRNRSKQRSFFDLLEGSYSMETYDIVFTNAGSGESEMTNVYPYFFLRPKRACNPPLFVTLPKNRTS